MRFGSLALLVYMLLTIPWPGLRSNYVYAFEKGGGHLVNTLGWQSQVRIRAIPGESARYDSRIILGDLPAKRQLLFQPCDAWSMGYRPLAILLSLVAAMRLSLAKKLKRLIPALLLLSLYVALRLCVVISHGWHAREASLEFASSAGVPDFLLPQGLTSALFYSIHHSPMSFIIPAAIWALCFRTKPKLPASA